MRKEYTLYQLNHSIRNVLLEKAKNTYWISAEIADIRRTDHVYLELVQKEQNQIIAKARANLWQQTYLQLHQRIGSDLANLLQKGARVLIEVGVSFHEVYGLSLIIHDIDLTYTLGELELRRLHTIEQLTQEHLLHKQKPLRFPSVIQRIALISSADAAGYGDFVNQLAHNAYGYQFHTRLFPAAVQGARAETEIPAQFGRIAHTDFDAVILIRGGGSRLDLEAFNYYEIAAAIAQCPLPVITGIGHLRDETVSDLVAKLSLKTPTAAAEFVIHHNAEFEQHCLRSVQHIVQQAHSKIKSQQLRLNETAQSLSFKAHRLLQEEKSVLLRKALQLQMQAQQQLRDEKSRLLHAEKSIDLLHPDRVLKRGYSITLYEGKPITAGTEIRPGGQLLTKTQFGDISSEVTGREKSEDEKGFSSPAL